MQTLKYIRAEEEKKPAAVGLMAKGSRTFGLIVQLSGGGVSEVFSGGDSVDVVVWKLRQLADRLERFAQERTGEVAGKLEAVSCDAGARLRRSRELNSP